MRKGLFSCIQPYLSARERLRREEDSPSDVLNSVADLRLDYLCACR